MKNIAIPISTPKKILGRGTRIIPVQEELDSAEQPLSSLKGTASGSVGAHTRFISNPFYKGMTIGSGANDVTPKPNAMQQSDAELAAHLPLDFPIDAWDKMSTKAQLQAMKFSGLTAAEQWRLLNLPVPLTDLVTAGRAKQEFIVAHAGGKVLPAREPNTETPKTAPLQLKKSGGELTKDTPLPVATPRPGPTPQVTPSSAILDEGIAVPRADRMLSEALATIDGESLSSSGKKLLALTQEKLADGSLSSDERSVIAGTYLRLKDEEIKSHFLATVTANSQPSATWDTSIITRQEVYTSSPGTFGKKGSIANNACGIIAIHDTNQALDLHTDFKDTYYNLCSIYQLTALGDGELGLNPLVIGSYYRTKGFSVTLYGNIENVPQDHDAYIMLYIYQYPETSEESGDVETKCGGHYIAVHYDQETKQLVAYNNRPDRPIEFEDSFEGFILNLGEDVVVPYSVVWGIDKGN